MNKSKPGRPKANIAADASENIVQAACLHFASHGIKASSNRQIAEEAGVTPAMVHYYFRKPEALYLAVLESAFQPLIVELLEKHTLQQWVNCLHQHLLARPWFPHLMLREVLSGNGLLRPLFLEQFAPHIFGSVRKLVQQEIKKPDRRPKLNIDRHVVLLMGMLVYPFLSMEVAAQVTGKKFDHKMLRALRDDALCLFLNGISQAA